MPSFTRAASFAATAALAFISACSGGSGGPGTTSPPASDPTPPTASLTKAEAFRFLNQATFGATEAEAQRLIALGDPTSAYSRWVDEQMTLPASTQLAFVQAARPAPAPEGFDFSRLNFQRRDIWFQNSVRGNDQLRQRVAWALSQILVVSQNSLANRYPLGLTITTTCSRAKLSATSASCSRRSRSPDDGRVSIDVGESQGQPGAQHPARRAIIANVCPLVAPTTFEQYMSGSVSLPLQLFSHNDQQDQWHSLKAREVSKSGWAGRIADVLAGHVANQQLPLNVSLSGQTLYQAGAISVPYTMGADGPTLFTGLPARRQAFESVTNTSYNTVYERAFAKVQQRALDFGETVSTALGRAPALTSLPDNPSTPLSGLATQLRTVAKLIAAQ